MLNLIKRDFGAMRQSFIFIAVYTIFFSLIRLLVTSMLGVLGTYIVVYSMFGVEERDKIDLLNRSLPVTAKEVVGSRYTESIIVWALVSLLSALGTWIASFFDHSGLQIDMIHSLPSVLAASFAASMLLTAVTVPVIYKFGYIKSRVVMSILWIGIALLLPTILVIFDGTDTQTMLEYSLSANITLAALAVLSLILTAVSYAISLRLYKRA